MKNIHILSTDKPSRFYSIANTFSSGYGFGEHYIPDTRNTFKNCNIYITNDEFIEEGDFALNLNTKTIVQYDGIKGLNSNYKKIILTTDVDLIKDGVQAIDDEFLEWFVKNPSCDRIDFVLINDIEPWYKIRFPKEETKQEEINFIIKELNEERKRVTKQEPTDEEILEALKVFRKAPLIFVPNERMYSEEDLLSAFEAGMMFIGEDKGSFKEWFKQFKKTNNGK